MLASGQIVVGRYRVEALRRSRSDRATYAAHDLVLDRPVVITVLAAELSDRHLRRRLQRAALVDHPNVVPLYDVLDSPAGLLVVERLVEGPTLQELLASGRLDLHRALDILGQVAAALDAAHDNGLLHPGLGPQDVVMAPGDHARLSGIGLAGPGWASAWELGSIPEWAAAEYLAPELVRGARAEPAADVYALGAMLYEAFTGAAPYARESPMAVLAAHLNEPPPRVSDAGDDLSSDLDEIVAGAMAKEPADRPRRASTVIEASRRVLEPAIPPEPPAAVAIGGHANSSVAIGGPANSSVVVGDMAVPAVPDLRSLLREAARAGVVPLDAVQAAGRTPPPPSEGGLASGASWEHPRSFPAPSPAERESPAPAAPPPASRVGGEGPAEPASPAPAAPPPAPTAREVPLRGNMWSGLARLSARPLLSRAVVALASLGALAAVAKWLLDWFVVPAPPPPPALPDPGTDIVDCTVFAPPAAARGETIMVQAFAHVPEQADDARAIALELDVAARRRGFASLQAPVPRGARLTFELQLPGLEIDEPVASLVWRGRTGAVQFLVAVPGAAAAGTRFGTLAVSLDSAPLGHVKFRLDIGEDPGERRAEPTGDDARRYTTAFVSYASRDRDEVLQRVQMLTAMDIRYFQDVLDIEPGDRWQRRLELGIDECDLFLLFWSRSAKRSKWVREEVRHALARKRGDDRSPPEIRPVIIEGPPVIEPWEELSHLHFNDRVLYFMARR